jgi:hypothetical protein
MDSKAVFTAIKKFKVNNPVREELSGERNLEMSKYIREKCRPSKSGCFVEGVEVGAFTAHDLDFILVDYKRDMLQLLEVKTRNGNVSFSQSETLKTLDKMLRISAPFSETKYLGYHVLIMNGLEPNSSTSIKWDGKKISQEECWRKINMLDEIFDEDDERDERMNRRPEVGF